MTTFVYVLLSALNIYSLLLLVRILLNFMMSFMPTWQPRGFMALVVEAVFIVTDPVVKTIQRLIPPMNIGGVQLDVSVLIALLAISLISRFLGLLL